jgi:hypothetical protein
MTGFSLILLSSSTVQALRLAIRDQIILVFFGDLTGDVWLTDLT